MGMYLGIYIYIDKIWDMYRQLNTILDVSECIPAVMATLIRNTMINQWI